MMKMGCLKIVLFILLVTAMIGFAPAGDFPEAGGFPEADPVPGSYEASLDFHGRGTRALVVLAGVRRVEYPSGRVATLHAARGLAVEPGGAALVRLDRGGRLARLILAGIERVVPDPYTHEAFYGWRGGPLYDTSMHPARRRVELAEVERHALARMVVGKSLWVEFAGPAPARPGDPRPAWAYSEGGQVLNHALIAAGMAHAARRGPGRDREPGLTLESDAAQAREGLWDEARWREAQGGGFGYLRDPRRASARSPAPSRRGR